MSRKLLPYTVVGFYIDSREQDTYVAWVQAPTVEHAIEAALREDSAREGAFVVAVFEGHVIDKAESENRV
ncbi:hypothetical protein LCGC14_0288570 [marine sediment metagenome]|uniref:Uncharacterized protein n=1 Tax=marine sediment metagenome TaxID=412755 RepID=A0A0F9TTN7_9ZZZZ